MLLCKTDSGFNPLPLNEKEIESIINNNNSYPHVENVENKYPHIYIIYFYYSNT